MNASNQSEREARYFVRIIPSKANVISCLHLLKESKFKDIDAANELASFMFGKSEGSWSVYSVEHFSRYDESHAIALVAVTIGSRDFDRNSREKYDDRLLRWYTSVSNKKEAKESDKNDWLCRKPPLTVIFPAELVGNSVVKTPDHNGGFREADDLHYDIRSIGENIGTHIATLHSQSKLLFTFLTPFDYQIQAGIAMSSCIRKNGCRIPPRAEGDVRDKELPPSEQWERLRYLAGDAGFRYLPS